jgi:hypothetical protein
MCLSPKTDAVGKFMRSLSPSEAQRSVSYTGSLPSDIHLTIAVGLCSRNALVIYREKAVLRHLKPRVVNMYAFFSAFDGSVWEHKPAAVESNDLVVQ